MSIESGLMLENGTKSLNGCEIMDRRIPVVLFVYRRPDNALKVFDRIRQYKPEVFILVSDGPRDDSESHLVEKSRQISKQVDWDCEVVEILSSSNLGCKQRFFTALDIIFSKFDRAIILEDDCVPNLEFFDYCCWGLNAFELTADVALVSGSNLYPIDSNFRNGFSSYMNCWGWATWARTWWKVNRYIGIRDLKSMRKKMLLNNFRGWEARFWSEVLKHTLTSNSIWDFYIQYYMLSTNSVSVYPSLNLVENIGFDKHATHTTHGVPDYVLNSLPLSSTNILALPPLNIVAVDRRRDRELAAHIWSCSLYSSLRLRITNLVRLASA